MIKSSDSVLVNRATTQRTTIGGVISSHPGQFAGYSSGTNGGSPKFPQGSSPCNDLTGVVGAMDAVFQAGSLLPSNYQYWKAILQPGGVLHTYQPGDLYVGNTAFGTINTLGYPFSCPP
jgi:hypothetical protein